MGRTSSPYIYGDHWLDRRADGKAPDVWQIATYDAKRRRIIYRTTKERDLERARAAIKRYVMELNGFIPKDKQPKLNPLAVQLIPHLERYWVEHASQMRSCRSIAHNLRAFIGFSLQDEVGLSCTFDDVTNNLVERYRAWRMRPHRFAVNWFGELRYSRSAGVSESSFRRDLAFLKAAMNYALEAGIVPSLRPIRRVPAQVRPPQRTRVLTAAELGSMLAYSRDDPPLHNWILAMLATGGRPEATALMLPEQQYVHSRRRLDLHPAGLPRTTKRNPIVPVIEGLAEHLAQHQGPWVLRGITIHALRRRWRNMVVNLGLLPDVNTKTIRHTVASNLEWNGASDAHIAVLLGHMQPRHIRPEHAHYSPAYLRSTLEPLASLWESAHEAAEEWALGFAVCSTAKGRKVVVRRSDLAGAEISDQNLRRLAVPPRKLVAWSSKRESGAMPPSHCEGISAALAESRSAYFRRS